MNDRFIPKKISEGVDGCYIPSKRFKTARISVTAYMPLSAETACPLSLGCLLVSNGCQAYPTPMALSRRLDTLYGASLSTDTYKVGDMLAIRVGMVFADDRYLPTPIFDACTELLLDTLFSPAVDEGGFLEGNFLREQRIQIEEIEGEINDKRAYARQRLIETMFEGEPFGTAVTGTKEQTLALTRGEVYTAWQNMLKSAYFRVSVTAAEPHDEVFERFSARIAKAGRSDVYSPSAAKLHTPSKEVKQVSDTMAVAQGKLAMGFACKGGEDAESYKTMVMIDVLGGGPYSLLFTNVREKLSLCYYCAARGVRKKGLLVIDSGVEFDNMDKTLEAVNLQIEALKSGEFDDEIVEASKRALVGNLMGVYDSQTVTDHWYADRWFDQKVLSPEQLAELVGSVTKQDVVDAANGLQLDTVYRLLGK